MGKIGRSLKFPTIQNIIKANIHHIEREGQEYVGTDNLRNRGSLEWVLEVIQNPLFGIESYPSLTAKAAKLAWVIITRHVFWNGNKRTGMSVMKTFLRINGYRLNVTNDEIVEIARRIGGEYKEEDYSVEEFAEWIRDRLIVNEKQILQ